MWGGSWKQQKGSSQLNSLGWVAPGGEKLMKHNFFLAEY